MSFSPSSKNVYIVDPKPNFSESRSYKYHGKPNKPQLPLLVRRSEYRINKFPTMRQYLKKNTKLPDDHFLKLASDVEICKIESIVYTKKHLKLLKKINKSYVKLSYNQKPKESIKLRSNDNSPAPLKKFLISEPKKFLFRKIMRDASFNTDTI